MSLLMSVTTVTMIIVCIVVYVYVTTNSHDHKLMSTIIIVNVCAQTIQINLFLINIDLNY